MTANKPRIFKLITSFIFAVALIAGSGDKAFAQREPGEPPIGKPGENLDDFDPSDHEPQTNPTDGSFQGTFSGKTIIRTFDKTGNRDVAQQNINSLVNVGWQFAAPKIEAKILEFLQNAPTSKARRLKDISITLGNTKPGYMTLVPSLNQVQLIYAIPGNQIRFVADVNNAFDPTITIRGTIVIKVVMSASGLQNAPIRFDEIRVSLGNVTTKVSGHIGVDIQNKVLDLFGYDIAAMIKSKIDGQSRDVRPDIESQLVKLNNKVKDVLGPYTIVRPRFDYSRRALVIQLHRRKIGTGTIFTGNNKLKLQRRRK